MSSAHSKYTIVVTGVGAVIGQGIVRSLRKVHSNIRVIGVDRDSFAAGKQWCDTFIVKPEGEEDSPLYDTFWSELVTREGVDMIIPSLDVDVFYLNSKRDFFSALKVVLALNTPELIHLARDKWLTLRALQKNGIPHIPSLIEGDWEQLKIDLGEPPFLMKPRVGSGSKGIVFIKDRRDYDYWKQLNAEQFIIQRIVGSAHEEFTVASFGFGDGSALLPLIMKRSLGGTGSTQKAEVVQDMAILDAVERLNRVFRPLGPTNYQFRKEKGKPLLLEINARISSSTSIRTAFGYNEAHMCLEYFLLNTLPTTPNIRPGRAVRYYQDYVELT